MSGKKPRPVVNGLSDSLMIAVPATVATLIAVFSYDDFIARYYGAVVHFSHDSSDVIALNDGVKDVISLLKSTPDAVAELRGCTDTTGSAARNAQLAVTRPEAVAQFMIQEGVQPDQIKISPIGEACTANQTGQPNPDLRSVDISVIKGSSAGNNWSDHFLPSLATAIALDAIIGIRLAFAAGAKLGMGKGSDKTLAAERKRVAEAEAPKTIKGKVFDATSDFYSDWQRAVNAGSSAANNIYAYIAEKGLSCFAIKDEDGTTIHIPAKMAADQGIKVGQEFEFDVGRIDKTRRALEARPV